MPRPRNVVPVPRNHKGRAVLDVYENGTRRTLTLGAWGSAEAEAEYKRFLAEFASGGFDRPTTADVTVNEVLLAFLKHTEQHDRRADGTSTNELVEYRHTLRVVRALHGHIPAKEFGPLALKAVRQRMMDLGWCRPVVNKRVGRVKRVFKWAASEELVPVATYQSLATVAGLQKGRTDAREPDPVGPVDDTRVDAVLPFLNRHVRGLVEFQRLTGCRPGEACRVRKLDINTSGPVWFFRPAQHKTAHRGKPRVIPIGPKAQVLLAGFFIDDPAACAFSPADSNAAFTSRVLPLEPEDYAGPDPDSDHDAP
jgi:integrase